MRPPFCATTPLFLYAALTYTGCMSPTTISHPGAGEAHVLVRLRQATVRRAGVMALHVPRFDLEPGQHWAILGGNGAGKSTFFGLLRGDLWPLAGRGAAEPPRLYGFGPVPVPSPIGAKSRMPLVSAEQQLEYRQQGWRISALEAVLAGMFDARLLYAPAAPWQRETAMECLERMDAADLAHRLLPELSQGELRRVLVARALAACREAPSVLLLDEVCDGLDPKTRRSLLAGLERIMAEQPGDGRVGVQLCCASHRLEELPRGLTHVARFRAGRLLSTGTAESIPESFSIDTTFKIPTEGATKLAVNEENANTAAKESSSDITIDTAIDKLEPLLELRNVDVYRNGQIILEDITWTMHKGEHWALVGGNGAGKSTLLALVCGELHPACVQGPAGALIRHFDQHNLAGLRQRIGLVAPHLEAAWDYRASALELAASGLDARIGLHGLNPSPQQLDQARQQLEAFGLGHVAERPFAELSTGQRRRCFLSRAMLAGGGAPALLVLDEPCAGLDPDARQGFHALLTQLAASTPLLLASHHHQELPPEITHFMLLEKGRLVAAGPRRKLRQLLERHAAGEPWTP